MTSLKFQVGENAPSCGWRYQTSREKLMRNQSSTVKNGYRVTSVPIQSMQPMRGRKELENIAEENTHEEEAKEQTKENKHLEQSKERRQKKGEKLGFKVNGELLQGMIKSAGKKKSKDENRCRIKLKHETVEDFYFTDEVHT